MKNKNLISRLQDLKKSKTLESVEGSTLQGIKGGVMAPCGTRGCNQNSKLEPIKEA